MFDFLLKNHKLLIAILVVGITMAIIAIILGLTMTITGTMIASFCLCFFAILFIGFSGYNLMYHPKTTEHIEMAKAHLNSSSSDSSTSSTEEKTEKAEKEEKAEDPKGGYFFYGD